MVIYTSGSTGLPKGIMVTHDNILRGAEIVAGYLGTTAQDRIAGLLPLSFDYGLNQLWQALHTGASLHLHEFVMPRSAFGLIAERRLTVLPVMPALTQRLFAPRFGGPGAGTDLSSVRAVTSTGGPVSEWSLDRVRETFPGAEVFLMYGLTEAFRSAYLDPALAATRPGSIGRAIPGVELHVVDEDGADAEVGVLVHRGGCVTRGYWRDPERTAAVFRTLPRFPGETVVWSGDLARRDADGLLYIIGRADFQLKRDGFRISPTEIEQVLGTHPAIAESIVVGTDGGDRGHGLVVLWTHRDGFGPADAPERPWLAQRLPEYMVPDEFRHLPALPTGLSGGKFDRLAARRIVAAGTGRSPLVAPILAGAAAEPDRTALRFRGATVSYGELARRVGAGGGGGGGGGPPRGGGGAGPATRTPDTVVAILGVLAAGWAYLPLNPGDPPARRDAILAHAGSSHAVDGAGLRRIGPGAPGRTTERTAVVFFTSGSTGAPKGVPVGSGNAAAFVEWAESVLRLGEHDRVGVYSPLFFDLSVLDLFVGLRSGSQLVLVPDDVVRFPRTTLDHLRDEAVTVLYTVPTALRALLAAAGDLVLPGLRHVLLAGEPFPGDELPRIRALAPAAEVHNLYGPIETNVVTHFTVPAHWAGSSVPIGTPAAGATLAVLDERAVLHALPAPVPLQGELLVSGPSVFDGYLPGGPVPDDPFVVRDGRRWYRTGDLVDAEPDGPLGFRGRRDGRVKVHGFLVDLSEVEQALLRHQEVAQVAVVAGDGRRGTELRAFVVPRSDAGVAADALRAWCGEQLPRYMWPVAFETVDQLPVGRTGKIDRTRLAGSGAELS